MLIKKIFDLWNREKQKLHSQKERDFYVRPREIWLTKMGQNIGFEENGKKGFKRPVCILKKVGNLIFVAAMTTKGKKDHPFYLQLKNVFWHKNHARHTQQSFVILTQVRVMDKKRFIEKMGIIHKGEFLEIQKRLQKLLF